MAEPRRPRKHISLVGEAELRRTVRTHNKKWCVPEAGPDAPLWQLRRLYQQVYQLRRNSVDVPRAADGRRRITPMRVLPAHER